MKTFCIKIRYAGIRWPEDIFKEIFATSKREAMIHAKQFASEWKYGRVLDVWDKSKRDY